MDTYTVCAGIKNLAEGGGIYTNRFLGAPGEQVVYEFSGPLAVNHLALLKLISLFTNKYGLILNVSFLASFPLIACASLFVLHKLGISYPSAVVTSLLYTFLPYHFLRGEHHFLLALYYVVPLTTLVLVWISKGEELFRFRRAKGQWFVTRKGAAAIAICMLMTVDQTYYAFFGACLLVVAAAIAVLRSRFEVLLSTAILLSVIAATFTVALLPSTQYRHNHGRNLSVAVRQSGESEYYGLKMAQMLLPVTGHRLNSFAAIKKRYSIAAPLVNENDDSSLGLIGSCGFLFLSAWVVLVRGKSSALPLLDTLAPLNVAAFLLGTIGGFGSIFALLVSPMIRSLNRISIFIAFFSLCSVALLADYIRPRRESRLRQALWVLGLAFLLLLGILDQTTKSFLHPNKELEAQFANNADFVSRIETSVPANAMIFQLPYVPFPESGPVNYMYDYDHLIGYLHSQNLRWSYGAMRGRETDVWVRNIASQSVGQMAQDLVFAGFSGIYIDRFGYADHATALEAQLEKTLDVKPLTSKDGRLSFFNLTALSATLHATYGDAEWPKMHDAVLPPVLATWELSCLPLEGTPDNNWHWCPEHGEFGILNSSSVPQKVSLEMNLSTAYDEPAQVEITTPVGTRKFNVSMAGTNVQLALTVPPGQTRLQFFSNARNVSKPFDWRSMTFRVNNFHTKMLTE